MASHRTQRFIEALTTMEAAQDPGLIVPLFAKDVVLESLAHAHPCEGRDAARTFWQAYLDIFDTIGSEFTVISEEGPLAVLEWTSQGTLRTGGPVSYRGVSILRFTANDEISRFATYYDTSAFIRQDVRHLSESASTAAAQAVS